MNRICSASTPAICCSTQALKTIASLLFYHHWCSTYRLSGICCCFNIDQFSSGDKIQISRIKALFNILSKNLYILDVQARNLRKPQCLWIMWGPPPRLICTLVGLSRHPNIYVGPFLTIFAIMMMSLWNIPLHKIHIMRTIKMLVWGGLVTWVHPRGLGVYKLPTDCHYILHLPKYFGEQQKWIIYYQLPSIISVLHTSDSFSNGKKR